MDMLLGVFIGGVIGVIAHEAGHAAMALMTGLRLRAITIGHGPTIFAGVFREIRIKINVIPFSGRVAIFPDVHQRRNALLLFACGGVAANILLGLGAVLLSASGSLPKPHWAVAGFYYYQAFLIIWNLIPQTYFSNGEACSNDGKSILALLEHPHDSPFMQLYLSMLAPYTNGKDPTSNISSASQRLVNYACLRLSGDLDRDERKNLFQKYVVELDKGELAREEELYVLDLLITDAVITGDPEAKIHIDDWSRRAMSLGPDIKTLKYSRAAALIELGRFSEGKSLAEAWATLDDKPFDSLLCNIFLARAEAGLGNRERADQLLLAARELLKQVRQGRLRADILGLIEETAGKLKSAVS